jgi:hypothetical protein
MYGLHVEFQHNYMDCVEKFIYGHVHSRFSCESKRKKIVTFRELLCKVSYINLYPFSVHVVTFTFHYQLMHLLIKTLSQFTFKTTRVKNVCDAYLKLILKTLHVSVSPPTIIRGQFLYLAQLLRVSLPASSHSSLWRYVVCTCILAMYLSVWCLDV